MFLASVAQVARSEPSPVLLTPENAPFDLARHADFYIESRDPYLEIERGLSLEDLISLFEADAFQPVTTRQLGFGRTWNVVHLRIPVQNGTDSPQTWVLAGNRALSLFNEVHLVIDGQPLPDEPLLLTDEWGDWQDTDIQIHTEFSMPTRSSGALFVSFGNLGASLPLTIETPSDYQERRHIEDIVFYAIMALIAGLAGLVLTLMIVIRHRSAFPYGLYVFSIGMTLCLIEGYLFRILGPWSFAYFDILEPLFINLTITGLLLFQRSFLAAHGAAPGYRRLLTVAAFIPIPMLIFNWMPVDSTHITGPMVAALFTLAPIAGAISVRQGLKGGIPFLLGSMAVTVSTYWLMFVPYFSSDISISLIWPWLRYAVIFEVLTFSLSMFAQVRGLRDEREEALRSQIRATQDKLDMAEALAATAHDIQQPLTSLRMAMQRLKGSGPDLDAAFDYLDGVLHRNLTTAYEAAIQAEHGTDPSLSDGPPPDTANETEDFEVNAVLEHCRMMFAEEARAKGLDLRFIATSKQAHGSPFVLMRILSNLISNAIKNTDAGKIVVGCRPDGHHLVLWVCDTGPGIAPDRLALLQQPYERDGPYPGTGLGLSIVGQLCAEHGLRFDMTSDRGRGTIARIRLPKAM